MGIPDDGRDSSRRQADHHSWVIRGLGDGVLSGGGSTEHLAHAADGVKVPKIVPGGLQTLNHA